MSPDHPSLDAGDRRTRRRLLEAANGILAKQGAVDGLLEQAVAMTGCSLERAQVFFLRDEDIVLALYTRFAFDLESRLLELPTATIAERFRAVMNMKFQIVDKYRQAPAALLATLLDPRHELGTLSPQTAIVRERVMGVVAAVVQGATDRPPHASEGLIAAIYGVHLGLMLLWCQDRSSPAQATSVALDLVSDLLGFVSPLLGMPAAVSVTERIDHVCHALLQTDDDSADLLRAHQILGTLFRHRRLLAEITSCAEKPCNQCLALHLPRVNYFLRSGQPLHLVLPAFPAKSPSRLKTLGDLPDQAEALALLYLQRMCDELQTIHPPGVRLTICSDGYVFSDLVGVSDDHVGAYGRELAAMIEQLGCDSIDTFSMDDLYEGLDFPTMRRHLTNEYALSLEQVEQRAHTFEHVGTQVNGIHRFLFEELADLHPARSRTQVRNECRGRAYEVVQRSDAWSRLLADCFPTAVRMSIHPQHPHSEKIGILLGESDDVWLTPWHCAAVRTCSGWQFMKVADAVALGARLIDHQGRPSHFELANDDALGVFE